jgi:hypothetical protein
MWMPIPTDFARLMPASYRGHSHFWQLAMSRRQFIGTTALATGGVLSAPMWLPALAEASGGAPKPIPGGIQPFGPTGPTFHVFPVFPGENLTNPQEPSTITDFNGFIGAADVQGTGQGTTATGTEPLLFDTDLRFMKGLYVDVSGTNHQGTFGFV